MRRIVWLVVLAFVLGTPAAAALAIALPSAGVLVDAGPARVDANVELPAVQIPLGSDATTIIEAPFRGVEGGAPARNAPTRGPATPAPSFLADVPPATTAAATTVGLFGFFHLLAALYSRFAPSELLDHERRGRVLALIRERPGIGPTDIGQALGTSWGVTVYHLERLEKGGLLTSQRVGHHRCYFLPGMVPRDEQRNVGMFRGDTTRRVAALVAEKPGLTQSQVASELGLSASAMSKQVSRLEAAGMLRREAVGTAFGLFPQPGLMSALVLA